MIFFISQIPAIRPVDSSMTSACAVCLFGVTHMRLAFYALAFELTDMAADYAFERFHKTYQLKWKKRYQRINALRNRLVLKVMACR